MAIGFAELLRGRIGKELDYGGYHFRRAGRDDEREAAYRLRHNVFAEEGFIDPSDFEEGLFRDQFDDTSAHLMVYDGHGEVIGTTRFVLPSALGFPTEYLFEFERPPLRRERLGEFGRLAILSEHRGGARIPMLGLVKMVYEVILELDITHVYAFMHPKLIASYTALGLVSHRLDVQPPSPEILERRAPMRRYFALNEIQAVLFDLREMEEVIGV
jgi:N-acyl-L-homoserine lactone synthetase